MSRATIKNFTPVLDTMTQKHGGITALVYGRVWRYCQGKNKRCQAAHATIAKELGISPKTVSRKIAFLVKKKYLKDSTPKLKNKPHTIFITGKAENPTRTESPSKSANGRTESPSQTDLKSDEERVKGFNIINRDNFSKPKTLKQAREHPLLKVLIKVCGNLYIRDENYSDVIDALDTICEDNAGKGGTLAEYLAPYWAEWLSSGFREDNPNWIIDWAQKGFIPKKRKPRTNTNKPARKQKQWNDQK